MRAHLPPRPFLGALLARATWLWVAFHAVAAAGLGAMQLPPEAALRQPVLGAIWIWTFTAIAVHFLAGRRGEILILANLGFPAVRIGGMVVAWCAALEVCLWLLAPVVT